jgi:hypothetical protein
MTHQKWISTRTVQFFCTSTGVNGCTSTARPVCTGTVPVRPGQDTWPRSAVERGFFGETTATMARHTSSRSKAPPEDGGKNDNNKRARNTITNRDDAEEKRTSGNNIGVDGEQQGQSTANSNRPNSEGKGKFRCIPHLNRPPPDLFPACYLI